jgi:tetratricopeptide (TPR) repeat protein
MAGSRRPVKDGRTSGASARPAGRRLPAAAWLLLAVLASFLLYARGLDHPWISDDHVILADNPTLRRTDPSTPLRLLTLDYWSALDADGRPFPLVGDRNLYRPATTISYWLNARLTGVTPAGLRAGNVVLHGLAAGTSGLLAASFAGGPAGIAAGLAVLVHPAGADVVNRIVGRADILVLLGIATFLLLAGRGTWTPWRAAASLLAAFTALGGKETGLALLPLAIAQSWLAPGGLAADPSRGRSARWVGSALALVATAAFLTARTMVVGWPRYEAVPGLDLLMNPLAGLGLVERLPAALSLAGWYVRMLVVPWPLLTLDRPAVLPGWGDPGAWLGLLVLALEVAGLVVAARRRVWGGLAPAWWLAMFALVGQLLAPIGTYREVRLVYPFLGALALGMAALAGVAAGRRGPLFVAGLVAVPLLSWMALSVMRTGDYASEIALYQADIRHRPDSPIAHLMLGVVYGDAGRSADARKEREAALALAPDSPQALNEMGAVEIQAGNFARAEELLGRALAREPDHHVALMNLGNLRAQQERLAEAHEILLRAEAMNPAYSLTQVNLALVEGLMGRTTEAARRADRLEKQNASDPNVALIRRLIALKR